MIDRQGLEALLPEFLGHQRWFVGDDKAASGARIVESEEILSGAVCMVWTLVAVGDVHYQVPLGLRETEVGMRMLAGQEGSVLGTVEHQGQEMLAYDALVDTDCCLALLKLVAGREATRARPVGAEQSNSSVVFDDQVIMKLFRRPMRGPNPEVEVALGLDRVGFNHLPVPLGNWRRDERDLAIVQEYLSGGVEGWALALTSLRDLLAAGMPPASEPVVTIAAPTSRTLSLLHIAEDEREALAKGDLSPAERAAANAGGDFAAEAARLGEMTARMHISMAEAFGTGVTDPAGLAAAMESDLVALGVAHGGQRIGELEIDSLIDAAQPLLAGLRGVTSPLAATRIHGDYHLGQVMRSDLGWFVLDFEGEPSRPLEQRRLPTSPLKDVAGMVRSFHYASAAARGERGASSEWNGQLGAAWHHRNAGAFLASYAAHVSDSGLLPPPVEAQIVLDAFEFEKAIYELNYELGLRPGWAWIPAEALIALIARLGASGEATYGAGALSTSHREESH